MYPPSSTLVAVGILLVLACCVDVRADSILDRPELHYNERPHYLRMKPKDDCRYITSYTFLYDHGADCLPITLADELRLNLYNAYPTNSTWRRIQFGRILELTGAYHEDHQEICASITQAFVDVVRGDVPGDTANLPHLDWTISSLCRHYLLNEPPADYTLKFDHLMLKADGTECLHYLLMRSFAMRVALDVEYGPVDGCRR